MYKLMIVDDEAYIRDELKFFLGNIDNVEVCAETGNGEEVLSLIASTQPDIVFLDIELRGMNGLTLARQINALEQPPHIIISTAYDKYAVMGFELEVVDYLLKPYSEERIIKAINRISLLQDKAKLSPKGDKESPDIAKDQMQEKIAVYEDEKLFLIHLDDIVYFQSYGNGISLVTSEHTYNSNLSLKELEKIVNPRKFHRIHKSFMVNVDCIKEIVPWFNYTCKLKLLGIEEELHVTRSYYKEFKERFFIK